MKKLIFTLTFLLIVCFAHAGLNNDDKIVKDTVINKVSYSLYEGAKGGRYILRTSAKTGKTYKQYFKHN